MTRRILSPLVLAGAVALLALTGCSAPAPSPDPETAESTAPVTPDETVVTDCPDGFVDTLAGNLAGGAAGIELQVSEISLDEFTAAAGIPADSFAGGCAFTGDVSGLTVTGAYLPGATDVADVFLAAGATDQGETTAGGLTTHSLVLDGKVVTVIPDGLATIEAAGQPEAAEFADDFPDGFAVVTVLAGVPAS